MSRALKARELPVYAPTATPVAKMGTEDGLWDPGLVWTADGDMWLFRQISLGPVADAATPELGAAIADPLMRAFTETAVLAGPIRITKRATAAAKYRQIRLMVVNMETAWVPPVALPRREALAGEFPDMKTKRRVALYGVKLSDRLRADDWRAALGSVAETLAYGGTQADDYRADFVDVDAAMARAGLATPEPDDLRLACFWWAYGKDPALPYMVHADHLHMFTSLATCKMAADAEKDGVDCVEWHAAPGTFPVSFAAVRDLGLEDFPANTDPRAWWVSRLLEQGALLVQMTGKVEPAVVTRDTIRGMKQRFAGDIDELAKAGKQDRPELRRTLATLTEADAFYSAGGTPTLTSASIIAAFAGRDSRYGYDPAQTGFAAGVELLPMLRLQEMAWQEAMPGSRVRANTQLKDLPVQTLVYSGVCDLSTVGDRPGGSGAVVGWTSRDRQLALVSATAAADQDTLQLLLIFAQTGGGKSMLLTRLMRQFCDEVNDRGERRPGVLFDPKRSSDFSAVADHVYDLSTALTADGAFDAIRFSANRSVAAELALSTLLACDPFGGHGREVEAPLYAALSYGIGKGAQATLQALKIACDDGFGGDEVKDIFRRVMNLESYPMFRAVAGMEPTGDALTAAQGLTYIRTGDVEFDIAGMVGMDAGAMDMPHRVQIALLRNIMYGSMMALSGRQGVLAADEAWVLTALAAGRAEIDRIARLARSQQVLPILATQKVTDMVNAGLAGAISRMLIGPIQDPAEAAAAFELAKVAPTEDMMRQMTSKGVQDTGGHVSFNWDSQEALVDPATRQVLRGAVYRYKDLAGRFVPVEVALPVSHLERVSTNRLDMLARAQAASVQPDRQIASLLGSAMSSRDAGALLGGLVGLGALSEDQARRIAANIPD